MKLPNGYGSVTKLKGRRRKPWAVRKTVLLDDGSRTMKYVGYYTTRAEALAALASYNKSPYKYVTMSELYDKWLAELNVADSTARTYGFAFKHLAGLADSDMARIRLDDLQAVFDGLTNATGKALKGAVTGIFSYAARHEYISTDRANIVKYVKVSGSKSREVARSVFTAEEISACKDHAVRVLLYTGLRISELLNLTDDCVHLEERYLEIRQAKTKAGVRKVPIAEKIVNDVKELDCFGMTYQVFKDHHFHYTNHTIHDTRHTFISMCADAMPPIDERITKAIVGHSGSGITETVYTHLDLSVLLDAVNRL